MLLPPLLEPLLEPLPVVGGLGALAVEGGLGTTFFVWSGAIFDGVLAQLDAA